jgi:GTP-binding protein
MRVLEAQFIKGATAPSGWPEADRPEIAVCGRSNVGKSTLLNLMLGQRVARVSQTPGRTRELNFFRARLLINVPGAAPVQDLLISDLPGFGYAKAPKAVRHTWRPLIEEYLTRRERLHLVVLLVDSRRVVDMAEDSTLIEEEEALCRWLLQMGKAVVPVMTKSDKLSKHERKPAAARLCRVLGVPPVIFSALHREGTEELWRRILAGLAARGGLATAPAGEGGRP